MELKRIRASFFGTLLLQGRCSKMKQPDASDCSILSMTRPVDTEIKRVTVTLPKRQLDALETIALREDVSVAWLVRKAVDKLLRQGAEIPVSGNNSRKGRT
jgi:hypothetical protein